MCTATTSTISIDSARAPGRRRAEGFARADHVSASNTQSRAGRGLLITFEGGDGAGKSTHIRILARELESHGEEVVCLREPGGTYVGERLRSILLNPKNDDIADETELLLYEAARAQLVATVIEPALARGAVVVCDRFTDSTVAYQGYGRGLGADLVARTNAFACRGIVPDRTILLVCGEGSLARATRRGGADRLEAAGDGFHAVVNEAFLEIARRDPDRVRVVESASRKRDTARAVFAELADLFPWMSEKRYRDGSAFAPRGRRPRKA